MTLHIHTIDELRSLYPAPKGRAQQKQLSALDRHGRRFIQLSPFVVVASTGAHHGLDASPRGGEPGFVKVLDEHTLLMADVPGNNRLDTLENIIETGMIGLLFMIPGVDETLRVNGSARLSISPEHIRVFSSEKRQPKLVIEVVVAQAYLHCAKAFMRSRLWDAASEVDRSVLPTMGQMINDQIGVDAPAESQADMLARYAADL
ncbi:MAG: MSMEG_1061 family FMN-dependent PPOX-type flavoprotein [Betaproteobacteria bacterium]